MTMCNTRDFVSDMIHPVVFKPSLPQELIDDIVDRMVEKGHREEYGRGQLCPLSYDDLLSCSFVSVPFRTSAIRHLFSLRTCDDHRRFLQLLAAAPHIAQSVRTLRLVIEKHDTAFGRVEKALRRSPWEWLRSLRTLLASVPITRVLFEHIDFPRVDDFIWTCVECFPYMEHLHLNSVRENTLVDFRSVQEEYSPPEGWQPPRRSALKKILFIESATPRICQAIAAGHIGRLEHLKDVIWHHSTINNPAIRGLLERSPVAHLHMVVWAGGAYILLMISKFYLNMPFIVLVPCTLHKLEKLTIPFQYLDWLVSSISIAPPGSSQLKTIVVRSVHSKDDLWQQLDSLVATHLTVLTTVRIEVYRPYLKADILRNCPRLGERVDLQWAAIKRYDNWYANSST
ncbi:hypothetical protein CPB85DRAFT_1332754 [Mucidula mucida]|nr:hypothetical protein CPB85DRAFT_1332754 [Mucidula mucida]